MFRRRSTLSLASLRLVRSTVRALGVILFALMGPFWRLAIDGGMGERRPAIGGLFGWS
jgi:hypothetical protein